MTTLAQIHARQAVLSRAGLKFAFEFVDVRDVERTPVWMHANNALIDKLTGTDPGENPFYHPGFASMDERTLLSMLPEKEIENLKGYYPSVEQFLAPPDPVVESPAEIVTAKAGLKQASTLRNALIGGALGTGAGYALTDPGIIAKQQGRSEAREKATGALAGGLWGGLGAGGLTALAKAKGAAGKGKVLASGLRELVTAL